MRFAAKYLITAETTIIYIHAQNNLMTQDKVPILFISGSTDLEADGVHYITIKHKTIHPGKLA